MKELLKTFKHKLMMMMLMMMMLNNIIYTASAPTVSLILWSTNRLARATFVARI